MMEERGEMETTMPDSVAAAGAGRVEKPWGYELIATALLTGARPSELLALRAEDVSFDRSLVLIRGTKTDGAFRSVPLWPHDASRALAAGPVSNIVIADPSNG